MRRPNGLPVWLVFFTLEGEGFIRTPAGRKLCRPGDVALLRSGISHHYGTSPGQRWNFVWAHFPALPELRYLPEEEVPVHHAAHEHVRKRIHRSLRGALQDSRERGTMWRQLCLNAIAEVVLLVAEGQRRHVDSRIELALHLLSQRMKEQVRVEDVARAVGLSPSRLSHLFKAETGESIVEALNRLRIREAALLIGHSGRTATEAAFDVGFRNYNHFAAMFRAQLGVSPREYRRRLETPE